MASAIAVFSPFILLVFVILIIIDIIIKRKNHNKTKPDKLLISGNGKGNSAIFLWGFVYLLLVIGGGALMDYTEPQMQSTAWGITVKNQEAIYFYYLGLITVILCVIYLLIFIHCIRKTQINVYENYIEGIGVGKYFLFGDFRTKRFKLAYDQITSFDATGNAIAIHASSTQYNCYVSNAGEIQSVIFNQKQNVAKNRIAPHHKAYPNTR